MNILAIDASGIVAGCAVMRDGVIVHTVAMRHGLTHSQTLMPAIEEALGGAEMSCADVDVFAAVVGPGSFTGVRIGVCTAKGMAHAVGKPCCPVDALEALSVNFYGNDAVVCPILDARHGQVYCAAFDAQKGMPERILRDDAVALEDFLKELPENRKLIFTGDAAVLHGETIKRTFGERAWIAPENLRDLRPDAVCVWAAAHPEAWVEAHALRPLYLRLSQAERERNRRLSEGNV